MHETDRTNTCCRRTTRQPPAASAATPATHSRGWPMMAATAASADKDGASGPPTRPREGRAVPWERPLSAGAGSITAVEAPAPGSASRSCARQSMRT